MSPPRLGAWVLGVTLVLDQVSKLGLLFGYDMPNREPIELGPFVTFVTVWNRGISYGLFQQSTDWGRWALVALSVVATVAIVIWLRRTRSRLLAVSLGLIAGGAVGNLVDRVAYGAVFDFVLLHVGSVSWYVFNIADAAIVAGVAGLIYDALFLEGRRNSPEESTAKPS